MGKTSIKAVGDMAMQREASRVSSDEKCRTSEQVVEER
jgi:hypothetical protein